MKGIKTMALIAFGYLLTMQQVFAQAPPCEADPCNGQVVPEIDGSGAIIAIGLVVGLVVLIREKFHQ